MTETELLKIAEVITGEEEPNELWVVFTIAELVREVCLLKGINNPEINNLLKVYL